MSLNRKALRRVGTRAAVVAVIAVLVAAIGFEVTTVHGSGTGGCVSNPSCRTDLACPVVFEAALGSGEVWAGNTNLTSKVSPALYTVYKNIALPPGIFNPDGSTKPIVSMVKYQALPVNTLWSGVPVWPVRLVSNLDKYLGSEHDGVAAFWTAFAQARHACASTQFILAGYSQGAMVVHDFLNQLAATGYTDLQASIIGAVLIADPDRVKHAAVPELATAPNSGYGVCDVASTAFHVPCPAEGPLQDIDPMFQSRTVSVCGYDDAVCDTSDIIGAADLITSVRYGIKVHTSYQNLPATGYAGTVMDQLLAAAL